MISDVVDADVRDTLPCHGSHAVLLVIRRAGRAARTRRSGRSTPGPGIWIAAWLVPTPSFSQPGLWRGGSGGPGAGSGSGLIASASAPAGRPATSGPGSPCHGSPLRLARRSSPPTPGARDRPVQAAATNVSTVSTMAMTTTVTAISSGQLQSGPVTHRAGRPSGGAAASARRAESSRETWATPPTNSSLPDREVNPFGLARAGSRPPHELRQLNVGDCRWQFVLTDGDTVTVLFDDRGHRNLSVAAVVERGLLRVTRP